jgi:hypothetical protein
MDLLESDGSIKGQSKALLKIGCQSVSAIRSADEEIKLLSALELGEYVPVLAPAHPHNLLRRAADMVGWVEVSSGCRVETECTGQGLVSVDEEMLVRAYTALIELGLRRSKPGRRLNAIMHVGNECSTQIVVDTASTGPDRDECMEASISCRIIRLVAHLHGGSLTTRARDNGQIELTFRIPSKTKEADPTQTEPNERETSRDIACPVGSNEHVKQ